MRIKLKTSCSSLKLATRKHTSAAKQQIAVRGNILIRANLRKCLSCGGIRNFVFGKPYLAKGFQPISEPYKHLNGCANKF